MKTLLRIDSSPRSARSHSRQLTTRFSELWTASNPEGKIVHRDLAACPVPLVSDDWIAAAFSDPADHTPSQQSAIATSDGLVNELLAADEIVIGTPMHNFSITGTLKAWIDQVVRVGRTVEYPSYRGLVTGKKAILIATRGGPGMDPGEPGAHLDAQVPYLVQILNFIGISEISTVYAGNLAGAEETRRQSLERALSQIESLATGRDFHQRESVAVST